MTSEQALPPEPPLKQPWWKKKWAKGALGALSAGALFVGGAATDKVADEGVERLAPKSIQEQQQECRDWSMDVSSLLQDGLDETAFSLAPPNGMCKTAIEIGRDRENGLAPLPEI